MAANDRLSTLFDTARGVAPCWQLLYFIKDYFSTCAKLRMNIKNPVIKIQHQTSVKRGVSAWLTAHKN